MKRLKAVSTSSPEQLRELMARAGKGTAISAVAAAVFPVLEEMKEQVFCEFAHLPLDSMQYAKVAGKAAMIDTLMRTLSGHAEDGKAAVEEIQKGGK